jgi:hypothetical protein
MKIVLVILISMLFLTGCTTKADLIKEQAKAVQACVEAGGEWYNTPGWGESCNFDTRKKEIK